MALELADIFHRYDPAYRQKYAAHLLPSHRQAMLAIERCRTEALGGQVYSCVSCSELRYSYHSCRNRHCPKCQHEQTQAWLKLQQQLLLPVPYFMLTFTLPEGLREAASRNQKLIYHALFQASAEATQKLAQDPRYVGGQIGMVGVLHTLRQAQGKPGPATWLTTHMSTTLSRAAVSPQTSKPFDQAHLCLRHWRRQGRPGCPLTTISSCQLKPFPNSSVPNSSTSSKSLPPLLRYLQRSGSKIGSSTACLSAMDSRPSSTWPLTSSVSPSPKGMLSAIADW